MILGVLAATVLVAVAATAVALAATQTQTSIYSPFTASGESATHVKSTVRGHCFTGSLAVNHQDAWRCLSGNLIYDPCFSSAGAAGIVLCPASGPWGSSAIEIKLTEKLPSNLGNKGKPSTSGLPWALMTVAGWKCKLATGATSVVDGKRQNYFCTGTEDALWGAPSRKSEPWSIYAAPNRAKKLSRRVAIKFAWF